jgi:hypothetical protein
VLLLLACLPVSARTIYVSKSGNDGNDGTTTNRAVRTVTRAHALASVSGGDVISVGAGIYLEAPALTKRVALISRHGAAFVGACPYPEIQVSAGPDRSDSICLPTAANPNPTKDVALAGSAVDGCGQQVAPNSATWSFVSGPAGVTFLSQGLATTARFTSAGTYVLRLRASDGRTAHSDEVTVTLAAQTCGGPTTGNSFTVNAGPDWTGDTTTRVLLQGEVKRNGVLVQPPTVSVLWSNATPTVGTVMFENAFSPVTWGRFSRAGTYTLRLWAKETSGAFRSASDTVIVRITETPTTTCTLTVNAGDDLTLQRPAGSTAPVEVTLNGSTLTNGRAATVPVEWTAPPGVTLDNARVLRPKARFTRTGTFILRLCGTACGGTVCDEVTVTVQDAPCPTLAVSAGGDQTLFWDDTGGLGAAREVCTTLSGSVNPAGGATIRWSRVSGPATVSFTTPNSTSTRACFSAVGTYVLRLTASVGTCTTWDDVVVTVKYAAKHYIGWRLPNTPDFCCGTTYLVKNTHPTCPIRTVLQPTRCIQSQVDPPPVPVTLEPGEEYALCTGGWFSVVSAEFLCSVAAADVMPAAIRMPTLAEGQFQAGAMEFLAQGASGVEYWVEASEDLQTWTKIALFAGGAEAAWVSDPDAAQHPRRFYRITPKE